MKEIKIKISYFLMGLTFFTFLFIMGLFFSYSLIQKKFQIKEERLNVKIHSLEKELSDWKKQYKVVLKIKNEFRDYVKEIVDLLYLKDIPLGGSDDKPIKNTDTINIKLLQKAVNDLEEEHQLFNDVRDYLKARNNFISSFPFIYPVKDGNARPTSGFGFREEKDGIHFHAGIDLAGKLGEPIIATADGYVYLVERHHPLYGKLVIIQHKYHLRTYYAHLNSIRVKIGQKIKRGDIIGTMGNTGRSEGVHLHYEIRVGDKNPTPIDPMMFLSTNY